MGFNMFFIQFRMFFGRILQEFQMLLGGQDLFRWDLFSMTYSSSLTGPYVGPHCLRSGMQACRQHAGSCGGQLPVILCW